MKYWRTQLLFLFILAFLGSSYYIFSNKEQYIPANTEKLPTIYESYKVSNEDNDSSLAIIDNFLLRFMRREGLKGGISIAISKDGKLVYSKGLGFSNIEDSISMQPYNQMRVASVSKLITATAIMKLIEQGKISLHQTVFGQSGILNDSIYLDYKDKRMDDVTVFQLLNHSGGWTARWGDPMFMPHSIARQMNYELPISMKDIIVFMHNKRMHFTPGSGSVYSNFGYGILGEIVSKVSGMSYEQYVKKYILNPLGIFDMGIGYSYKNQRLKNEVLYYEADSSYVAFDYRSNVLDSVMVRRAYGGTDIQTLGSAGGWVANVTDLMKFILTIDGIDNVPDILTQSTIDTMVCVDKGFDPIGWRTVIDSCWYRSGTLAATSAMIARHPDSLCYVVLLNSANHRGPELATSLRIHLDNLIDKITQWPDKDLLQNDSLWQKYLIDNQIDL